MVDDDAVLVSNTGLFQSDAGSVLNTTFASVAHGFTTGPVSAGYKLRSIGIRFKAIGDLSTVGSELTVTLNEDSSGEPGNALCTLTDPSSFSANAVNTFTAPTTGTGVCPTLASNQSYFVVITRANNTTDAISYNVEGFDEDLGEAFQDTGGAEGWSVERARTILSPSSSNWVGQSDAMLFEGQGRGDSPRSDDLRIGADHRRGRLGHLHHRARLAAHGGRDHRHHGGRRRDHQPHQPDVHDLKLEHGEDRDRERRARRRRG